MVLSVLMLTGAPYAFAGEDTPPGGGAVSVQVSEEEPSAEAPPEESTPGLPSEADAEKEPAASPVPAPEAPDPETGLPVAPARFGWTSVFAEEALNTHQNTDFSKNS